MTAKFERELGQADECLDDAAFVLGALSPTERVAFERHLAGCAKCQASVQRLAGLPGLLTAAGAASLTDPDDVADADLLPRLQGQVRHRRRRRRLVTAGSLLLAAACAATAVVLALRPATTTPVPQASAVVVLGPVGSPAPKAQDAAVVLDLFDRKWGTAITIHCNYIADHSGDVYQLKVVDKNGQETSQVASWATVAGSTATVQGATALPRAEFSAVRVYLKDREILQAPVR